MVSKNAFAWTVRQLLDRGFRFTVIGGTVVELALGSRDLGPDIDVFAEEPNVFMEDEYYSVAEELGWTVGQTWLGTPSLIGHYNEESVTVEFYDNLYDFYVPEPMIQEAQRVQVSGVKVRMISLEDHILLKAYSQRGSDFERLKELAKLAKKGKLRVDTGKLRERASLFGEEERIVIRRLRDAGFSV